MVCAGVAADVVGPDTALRRIIAGARDLFPGYFAMVMATGAASIAAHMLAMRWVAVSLLVVNTIAFTVLWGLTLLRLALFFPRVVADLNDHARGPGFFTLVAGSCIFGSQWRFFTAVTIREHKPTIATGINGAWLIAAVATRV